MLETMVFEVVDFLRRNGEGITVGLVAGVTGGLTLGGLAWFKALVIRRLQIRFIRRHIRDAFEQLAKIPDRGERYIFVQGQYTTRERERHNTERRLLGKVRALLNHHANALTGIQRAELDAALSELSDVLDIYNSAETLPKGFAHYCAVYREFALLKWLGLPFDPPDELSLEE